MLQPGTKVIVLSRHNCENCNPFPRGCEGAEGVVHAYYSENDITVDLHKGGYYSHKCTYPEHKLEVMRQHL